MRRDKCDGEKIDIRLHRWALLFLFYECLGGSSKILKHNEACQPHQKGSHKISLSTFILLEHTSNRLKWYKCPSTSCLSRCRLYFRVSCNDLWSQSVCQSHAWCTFISLPNDRKSACDRQPKTICFIFVGTSNNTMTPLFVTLCTHAIKLFIFHCSPHRLLILTVNFDWLSADAAKYLFDARAFSTCHTNRKVTLQWEYPKPETSLERRFSVGSKPASGNSAFYNAELQDRETRW